MVHPAGSGASGASAETGCEVAIDFYQRLELVDLRIQLKRGSLGQDEHADICYVLPDGERLRILVAQRVAQKDRPELAIEDQRLAGPLIIATGVVHDVLQLVGSLQQGLCFDLTRRSRGAGNASIGLGSFRHSQPRLLMLARYALLPN